MEPLKQRLYGNLLDQHLARERQMALVSGPREVGKTTLCRDVAAAYLNWGEEGVGASTQVFSQTFSNP